MVKRVDGAPPAGRAPGGGLAGRCWAMIIALISGVASLFGIFGITLFDGRSILGTAPEWTLRKSLPGTEAPIEPARWPQDPAAPPVQGIRKAADAGPGVSLGMQPTTYAALPPASGAGPAARAPQNPFPSSASGDSSVYLFNNREVALQSVGDMVQVRYLDVRKEMADNGVKAGDLFVEFRLGGDLGGTARLRSKRCGVAPYDVAGVSEDDYKIIRLRGDARRFDETCRLTDGIFPMSIVLVRK